MSEKAECPGCNSYTSGVLQADVDNQPCPYCGLSATARAEIVRVRSKRADEKLRARIEELVKEQDKLTRRIGQLERFLRQVRIAFRELPDEDRH